MILVGIWTFITGLVIGWYINIAVLRNVMKHNPNELIESIRLTHSAYQLDLMNDDEDIDDPNAIIVSFEHVNSHWYLYDVSTNIFAGQGKSLEEAVAAVEARFPNKEVVVQQISEAL